MVILEPEDRVDNQQILRCVQLDGRRQKRWVGQVGYLYFYEFWVVYRIGQDVSDEGQESCMCLLQFRHRLGVF